jgi:glycosyltransferase involved in cell wall biosynthesis
MNQHAKISLVTTCKGRLSYLKESIPTWLTFDYPNYEIVVVDYDCPEGTSEFINKEKRNYLKKSKVKDIRVVKVENKPYFNLNDARSRGINQAEGELVLMIDSDIRVMRKNLLKRIFSGFRQGVVFFSHLQVLNSNYCEGRHFYEESFQGNIDIPLVLPITALVPGLTGTSCFLKSLCRACGGFKTEINEKGYGFDDREFYLRYLNYFFYHHFFQPPYKKKTLSKALDAVLSRFHCFRETDFQAMENTEEEKEEFYPMSGPESQEANRDFIRSFFDHFAAEAGLQHPQDIPRSSQCVPLLNKKKTPPVPVEKWFIPSYLFRCGGDQFHKGQFEESRRHLQTLIKIKGHSRTVERLFKPKAYIYLAKIHQTLGKQWKSHYLEGIKLLKRKQKKNALELFMIGSGLFEIGDFEGAERWLKKVLKQEKVSAHMRSGAYFLLGDIYRSSGKISWREFYREGLNVLEGKKNKNRMDIYKIASLYKRLEEFAKSEELFRDLAHKTNNFHTLSY